MLHKKNDPKVKDADRAICAAEDYFSEELLVNDKAGNGVANVVVYLQKAPEGYKAKREGIPHGTLTMIEYDSKTVGTRRKMNVYTPPGYTPSKKYPVLYLLHGIGGDETEWQRFAHPNLLLDNLIADGKAIPMIVVMPNGRAQKDDRASAGFGADGPEGIVANRMSCWAGRPAGQVRPSVTQATARLPSRRVMGATAESMRP